MGGNLLPQFGDPLCRSVFVEPLSDPFDPFGFKRFWNIKIGLPDAQIDGIFHLSGQVKDSSNPRGFDLH